MDLSKRMTPLFYLRSNAKEDNIVKLRYDKMQ